MCRMSKLVRAWVARALAVGLAWGTVRSSTAQQALVSDHTCTDLNKVPVYWVEQAKNLFKLSYGHTSHGSQIVTGMTTLNGWLGCSCGSCADAGCASCVYGFCDDYYHYKYGGANPVAPPGVLSFWDGKPEGASDLGSPDRTAWEAATRTMLEDPRYENRNLVMWSWCGQADGTPADIQLYLDLMSGLEADYPNVMFIYMTGHLNGTGVAGNLNQRNNQIRAHVQANGGVLFDFADIESYDPDGNGYLHLYANDECNYTGGNWADQWCATHPGSELCATCSCAHSRPLNCNLKGRAFWWMLARLAGWPGPHPGDMNCDGVLNAGDIPGFVQALTDPSGWRAAHPQCSIRNGDINDDGLVNAGDIPPFVDLLIGR